MNSSDPSNYNGGILVALASWMHPPVLIAAVIGIPSAVLYAAEVVQIVRYRKTRFTSAFYKLFLLRAFFDLSNYVNSYFHHRFTLALTRQMFSFYLWGDRWLLAWLTFYTFYSFSTEGIATVLISLNRLTAVALPMRQDRLWRRILPIGALLTFILPLPYNIPILTEHFFLHIQDDNVSYTFDTYDRIQGTEPLNYTEATAIATSILMLTSLGLNVAALWSYHKFRASQQSQQNSSIQQTQHIIERNLFFYALFTFIGHLIHTTHLMVIYVSAYTVLGPILSPETWQLVLLTSFNLFPLVSDLCTVILPAWLLVIASKEVRSVIFESNKLFAGIYRRLVKPSSIQAASSAANRAALASNHNQQQQNNRVYPVDALVPQDQENVN